LRSAGADTDVIAKGCRIKWRRRAAVPGRSRRLQGLLLERRGRPRLG